MSALIPPLFNDALAELNRREPQYLARFGIAFSEEDPESGVARRGLRWSREDLVGAVADILKQVNGKSLRITRTGGPDDPVATLLLNSARDALAAAEGTLDLRPAPIISEPLAQLLQRAFDLRVTASGRRYFVRRTGNTPLLLINALGVPLTVWSRLLSDDLPEFQIIVVENRCGDVVAGGMHSDVPLTQHASDLTEVLDCEGIIGVHLLAWCNGGRIGIEIARQDPSRVRSLILVSTTFKGVQGVPYGTGPFEDGLQQIFNNVLRKPMLAEPLVSLISRYAQAPDWDALSGDPVKRTGALFALPALEHATALLAPMKSADFLINYARRTAADERYPLAEALQSVRSAGVPMLMILGEHDNIVSNKSIRAALTLHTGPISEIVVQGAGHYIHDLQYPYFRWALQQFTQLRGLATAPSRLVCSR
jgi:pimeloyl-ACP methyl ester carboxylesterase